MQHDYTGLEITPPGKEEDGCSRTLPAEELEDPESVHGPRFHQRAAMLPLLMLGIGVAMMILGSLLDDRQAEEPWASDLPHANDASKVSSLSPSLQTPPEVPTLPPPSLPPPLPPPPLPPPFNPPRTPPPSAPDNSAALSRLATINSRFSSGFAGTRGGVLVYLLDASSLAADAYSDSWWLGRTGRHAPGMLWARLLNRHARHPAYDDENVGVVGIVLAPAGNNGSAGVRCAFAKTNYQNRQLQCPGPGAGGGTSWCADMEASERQRQSCAWRGDEVGEAARQQLIGEHGDATSLNEIVLDEAAMRAQVPAAGLVDAFFYSETATPDGRRHARSAHATFLNRWGLDATSVPLLVYAPSTGCLSGAFALVLPEGRPQLSPPPMPSHMARASRPQSTAAVVPAAEPEEPSTEPLIPDVSPDVSVVSRINDRFREGRPSTDLHRAGVIIHQFDGYKAEQPLQTHTQACNRRVTGVHIQRSAL